MGTTTLKASTLSTVMLFTGVLAIGAPGPIAETSGKRFECNPSNPILPAALVRARLANFRRLTRSGELSVTFIFLASVLISLLLILQGSWLIYGNRSRSRSRARPLDFEDEYEHEHAVP